MYAGMSTPIQKQFLTACEKGDNNTVRRLVANDKGLLGSTDGVSYHIVGCVILYISSDLICSFTVLIFIGWPYRSHIGKRERTCQHCHYPTQRGS